MPPSSPKGCNVALRNFTKVPLVGIIIAGLFAGLVYLFAWSSIFAVSVISITGAPTPETEKSITQIADISVGQKLARVEPRAIAHRITHLKWIESVDDFATRLVAFACVEGIFFSGSFCAIYWVKKRGLLPGLTFSNELISRDEGLHTEFAVALYHTLQNKLENNTIHEIIQSAVEKEIAFICDALPCSLIGMNSRDMTTYIQFVADRLAVQLGATKIYKVQNPFDFMD